MDICREIYGLIQSHLGEILALRSTRKLKADNTFVSKGDLLCQEIIFDYLKNTLDDYVVISEESDYEDLDITAFQRIITIDPIDGTENFVSGLKEWGVGISIYNNGCHEQSMLALPELSLCLCTGDDVAAFESSRICGLSSYMSPEDFKCLDNSFEYRIMGCCMYNIYNVIMGSYCRFLHLKGAYSWDILPGINLALEHGLKVSIEGKPYHGDFLMPGNKYRFQIMR